MAAATANGIAGGSGVLYQPVEIAPEEPIDAALAEVEALEFSGGTLALAADGYRRLAASSDARRRAAALLRSGRVLRKQRDWNGAVETYRRLLEVPVAMVGDQPKELVARQGFCRVYEETHDATALKLEALALARVLYSGEVRVDRATFELYRNMVGRWGAPPPPADRVAITEAAVELWRTARPPRGRRVISTSTSPVLAIWVGNAVFLGAPEMLGPAWAEEPERRMAVVRADEGAEFQSVFPGEALSTELVARALASYVRTIVGGRGASGVIRAAVYG